MVFSGACDKVNSAEAVIQQGATLTKTEQVKRIAVLIDADNAKRSMVKAVMEEISTYGHIVTKRAYGDWSLDTLKNWKTTLNEEVIQTFHQFSYTSGKNATDILMIIDAMDLLYENKYDAFVLVSSDSDFTRLAVRLREAEKMVIGVGEENTPKAFRNACDTFILTSNLDQPDKMVEMQVGDAKPAAEEEPQIRLVGKAKADLVSLLRRTAHRYQDDGGEGWVHLCSVTAFAKRLKPDFDPRSYGAKSLPELFQWLSEYFELEKKPVKGDGVNWMFRVKQSASRKAG